MNIDLEQLQKEVIFKTSRSSGAGGQHVNKVETKVTLLLNVYNSQLFTQDQKELIQTKLSNRIQTDGFLQLSSSESRSQLTNKVKAIEKLVNLISVALQPVQKRVPTKISRSKALKRMERRKRESAKKTNRRWRLE